MKVVLFCGGKGTRLGGDKESVPKPMIRIGYRPILWHIMKYYAHFGHKEFVLCLGHKADVIKNYFLNYNQFVSDDFTLRNGEKELRSKRGDLNEWTVNFVDTGIHNNIGERLLSVRSYLADDDVFLANYADGLCDINLKTMVEFFIDSGKVGCFICVRPSQTFHIVTMNEDAVIEDIKYVRESNLLINGGFFIFRRDLFDYIRPGEELVEEPFRRLIAEKQLIGYRYDRFWCMDTFKEHQELNEMYDRGDTPWQVWKSGCDRAGNGQPVDISGFTVRNRS